MHEEAYGNNLKKIQHATKKLGEVREKIQKYDAELKMSSAEAEVAKLAQSFNMDITTDFGKIEEVIQGKIDKNRAKVRVAADLSQEGHRIDSGRGADGEGHGRRCAVAVRGRSWGCVRRRRPSSPTPTKELGPAVTDEKATARRPTRRTAQQNN